MLETNVFRYRVIALDPTNSQKLNFNPHELHKNYDLTQSVCQTLAAWRAAQVLGLS
jgi:hypothetical protein